MKTSDNDRKCTPNKVSTRSDIFFISFQIKIIFIVLIRPFNERFLKNILNKIIIAI